MYVQTQTIHVDTQQLVSDFSSDPHKMFQPPSIYPQTPYSLLPDPYYANQHLLQNPRYIQQHYQQYYPQQYMESIDSQKFRSDSLCNFGFPYNFGSDSLFNSEFQSRSEFAFSSRVFTENARSTTYGITTTDLDFIKNGVRHMILMTERIQGNLDNISDLLLQSTKMLQSLPSIPTSDPTPTSTIVDAPPAKGAEAEKAKTTTTPAARKDVSIKKTPSEITAAQNIAEKSFMTYRSYILSMQKQVPLCSESRYMFHYWMLFEAQWFGSGKLYCVDKDFEILFDTKKYILIDVLPNGNGKKLISICVVVFDPGGRRGTTILLRDGPLRVKAFKSGLVSILLSLLKKRQTPLSDSYMQLFHVFLLPYSWERSGNVHALVQLLQAYLLKIPNELHIDGMLTQILGKFDRLVSVDGTANLGFFVINTVVESPFPAVLQDLLRDDVISRAQIFSEDPQGGDAFTINRTTREIEGGHVELELLNSVDIVAAAAKVKETHAFEIDLEQVENVKQRIEATIATWTIRRKESQQDFWQWKNSFRYYRFTLLCWKVISRSLRSM